MVIKRNYRRLMLRGLRSTRTRFLSILAIITVGVGFLAGLLATTPDMQLTADTYYKNNRIFDICLQDYVFGFDDGEARAAGELEYVKEVMPAFVKDAVVKTKNGTATVRIYGMPTGEGESRLNGFELLEGDYPQQGECLAAFPNGYSEHAAKGDVLELSEDTSDYGSISDTLGFTSLRISGTVRTPMYMSAESEPSREGTGAVSIILYVPYAAFTKEKYDCLFLTVKGAEEHNSFGEEYQGIVSAAKEQLKQYGQKENARKREAMLKEINGQIDKARTELAQKRREAEAQLGQAQDEIDSGYGLIRQGLEQAEKKRAAIEAMKEVLSPQQYAQAMAELDAQEKEIKKQVSRLESAQKELDEKKKEALDKLAQAEAELEEKAGQVSIPEIAWSITDRADTVSFSSYKSNSEKVAAIAKVFPVFFFMVAALVALTTMTRMVEEERTQTGTLKALGYSEGAIAFYYVSYAVLAGLTGGIVGVIIGFYTLPAVIGGAYGMMYTLPRTVCVFYPGYAVIIVLIAVAVTSGATMCACWGQLAEKPGELMRQKAPQPGKRILLERTPLWKHMNFSRKVAARNIFRYKKRLLMTVLGIAGCCALLLTGFGLRDSIHDIVDLQFGQIYRYNLTAAFLSGGDIDKAADILENGELITGYVRTLSGSGKVEKNGVRQSVTVTVPRDCAALTEQITLRNRKTGKAIEFGENSAVLTEKLAGIIGCAEGDTVLLTAPDGSKRELTVTGICENYLAGQIFIGPELYKSLFGEPDYNVIFAGTAQHTKEFRDELGRELLSGRGVMLVRFSDTIKESFSNTVKSMDSIVAVLIISAGLLAVIVLYNLTNINICERQKELATLKVLGFTEREMGAYVFRENIVMCFMGIAVGTVLGIFLHSFVVRTAEVDAVMFGRSIGWLSYVLSALITVLFTLAVDAFMRRRITSVDMVSAMKAGQ